MGNAYVWFLLTQIDSGCALFNENIKKQEAM
jgi:hypothetical protein